MRVTVFKKRGLVRDILFRPAKATRQRLVFLQDVPEADLGPVVLAELKRFEAEALRPQAADPA